MPEPAAFLGSIGAGAATTVAVAALVRPGTLRPPALRLRLRAHGQLLRFFAEAGERAGLKQSPERLLLAAGAVTIALAAAGAAAGSLGDAGSAAVLGLAGLAGGPAFACWSLLAAIGARRRRLRAQLTPLLELLSLELSSGASPGTALDSVTGRLRGELAVELRTILGASRIGGVPLETGLAGFGERNELPALSTLGGLVAAGREYGAGLSVGVRQLASELRREERRALIASSRRALNRVLVPSALGVLAPFMAILLYPALTTLARSFG